MLPSLICYLSLPSPSERLYCRIEIVISLFFLLLSYFIFYLSPLALVRGDVRLSEVGRHGGEVGVMDRGVRG